jgi:hypothetical protein
LCACWEQWKSGVPALPRSRALRLTCAECYTEHLRDHRQITRLIVLSARTLSGLWWADGCIPCRSKRDMDPFMCVLVLLGTARVISRERTMSCSMIIIPQAKFSVAMTTHEYHRSALGATLNRAPVPLITRAPLIEATRVSYRHTRHSQCSYAPLRLRDDTPKGYARSPAGYRTIEVLESIVPNVGTIATVARTSPRREPLGTVVHTNDRHGHGTGQRFTDPAAPPDALSV